MKTNFIIIIILGFFLIISTHDSFCQVGINANGSQPDPSAGLDVNFNDKGFLPPRLTFVQRNAIQDPVDGLMVFCTNCNPDGTAVLCMFQNGKWRTLTKACATPGVPTAGDHIPDLEQITWKWNTLPTAIGYKWNTTSNLCSAIDLGNITSFTETGLNCSTPYSRYIWAYNNCGTSWQCTINQTTSSTVFPVAPLSGIHLSSLYQIVWNWNPVEGATGYKWNTVNDYSTAFEMGNTTSKTETGVDCGTLITRYVWAHTTCGVSQATQLTQMSSGCPSHCMPVNDLRDGKTYKTIVIGNQCWMRENLNVGTRINGLVFQTNNNLIEKYCYNDLDSNCNIYGGLYQWAEMVQYLNGATNFNNFYTPAGNVTGICPAGWHLPKIAEWNSLTTFLGGTNVAGGKMKEPATTHWATPNMGATNESGFSGIPGGRYDSQYGYFWGINTRTDLRALEEAGGNYSQGCGLTYHNVYTSGQGGYKLDGLSVRCIKDCNSIIAPQQGSQIPGVFQITWTWNTVPEVLGYKWNTTNNIATAIDLGAQTSKTETGLNCNTLYTRYIWAYSYCSNSDPVVLTSATLPGAAILTTNTISAITATSAVSGGSVITDCGATVTARGVCWSTTTNPTINNFKTTNGAGTGAFTSNLTGLSANQTYFVRSYATNSNGTFYGNEQSFTTMNGIVTLTTSAASSITAISAVCGGNITNDGGAAVTERGVCWSTNVNPIISDNKTSNGNGTGTFTSNLTALSANTLYHIRAYATNSTGTFYGNDVSFTTLDGIIILTTSTVTNILGTNANSGGTVTSDGGAPVTAKGVCWSTALNPTIADSKTSNGTGLGSYTSFITASALNTTYHIRAYATNYTGTFYGNELTFNTDSVHAIGEYFEGGIVFYFDSVYKFGLISATTNQSVGAEWGCYGSLISGTSVQIGFGYSNSSRIVNGCNTSGIAAQLCDTLNLNGYSDWFLPSKDELNQIYMHKSTIGGFEEWSQYWSSTESDGGNAWSQSFYEGYQYPNPKDWGLDIRAVRAFCILSPNVPSEGTHGISTGQIIWNWNAVPGATGYKWNTVNDLTTATDMGGNNSKVETGLSMDSTYTRYVWAYNSCGTSPVAAIIQPLYISIGLHHQGGIIFYLDASGQHGLIAAPSDQIYNAPWGCEGTLISGTSTNVGSGQANTTTILNGCTESGIAARICDTLELGGYSDWYLPSIDELGLMYPLKNVIGGFSENAPYCSSSEYDANNVWDGWFIDWWGWYSEPQPKNYYGDGFAVRAIRSF